MKKRSIMIVAITLMAIGFATVTTNLIINGSLLIGNNDDFVVIFTSVKLNGVKKKDFISEDKKTITFATNTLTSLEDEETLEFEVTNTSRNYDANVEITCTPTDHEYVSITLPSEMTISAGTSETNTITARLKKVTSEEQAIEINCTLTATAEEKTELGNEYVELFSKAGTLMDAPTKSSGSPEIDKFWHYKTNITKAVFEPEMNSHETSEDLIFDVSDGQDESVMAYLVPGTPLTDEKRDELFAKAFSVEIGGTVEDYKRLLMEKYKLTEDEADAQIEQMKNIMFPSEAYTLYIQSKTGIKANSNSSALFAAFTSLSEIEGLEYLDTSSVTNMAGMFELCLNLNTLDLSNFDTSKVTNMDEMFFGNVSLTSLDLRNFDTSNVTDMSGILGVSNDLTDLYLGRIDINNNASTNDMFRYMPSTLKIHIKNNKTKEWVLGLNNSNRPTEWNEGNFILE